MGRSKTKRVTNFKWKTRTGRLTKKAKEHLSKKALVRFAFRRIKKVYKAIPERVKQIIHFKAIYDSPRGKSHDFFVEGELTVVTDTALSEMQLKNMIYEKLETGRFETSSAFTDFYDNMSYTDIEVGIETTSTKEEPEEKMEVYKYGYYI